MQNVYIYIYIYIHSEKILKIEVAFSSNPIRRHFIKKQGWSHKLLPSGKGVYHIVYSLLLSQKNIS